MFNFTTQHVSDAPDLSPAHFGIHERLPGDPGLPPGVRQSDCDGRAETVTLVNDAEELSTAERFMGEHRDELIDLWFFEGQKKGETFEAFAVRIVRETRKRMDRFREREMGGR